MIPVIPVATKTAKTSPILLGLGTAMIPLLIPGVGLIPSLIPAKNSLLMLIMESLETLESRMGTFRNPRKVLGSTAGIVCARSLGRYETGARLKGLPWVWDGGGGGNKCLMT